MANATEAEGDWPLQRLMTEVVGSGPKSAEDMTRGQAREAMGRILDGEPDPTTLGAFWLANRWKRNTPEELAAFLDVMREESVETARPDCDPVDCGANYDGKGRTALLGVGAGVVAAAAGTPVVVHSGDRVPTQKQDAYKHVLDELGVRTDLSPRESAAMTDEVGVGFYHQPAFNPGVHALFDRRDRMGVRTFVNTVETLANPANARVHLGSFYHLPFAVRIVETFQEARSQDVDRVLMFQGLEGYDDIRPGSTTVAEWTHPDSSTGSDAAESHDSAESADDSAESADDSAESAESAESDAGGGVRDFTIETAEYGMAFESEDLQVGDVAADSARITREVLIEDREDRFADAIALNAALRIYAREDADSIEEGLDRARSVIENGRAGTTLQALRSF